MSSASNTNNLANVSSPCGSARRPNHPGHQARCRHWCSLPSQGYRRQGQARFQGVSNSLLFSAPLTPQAKTADKENVAPKKAAPTKAAPAKAPAKAAPAAKKPVKAPAKKAAPKPAAKKAAAKPAAKKTSTAKKPVAGESTFDCGVPFTDTTAKAAAKPAAKKAAPKKAAPKKKTA